MNKIIKKLFIIVLLFLSISLFGCKEKIVDSIHTEKQAKYLSGDYKLASVYAKGSEDLSAPAPVVIDFSSLVGDASSYEFYLDLDESFNSKMTFTTIEKKITLYNLMIKKVYYYKVVTSTETSKTKAFIVDDDLIRNLYIDGITNARDIGGFKVNGKRINQGLLFRSSKFNQDESSEIIITEDGINTLVNDLKVKTEIDLRSNEDNEYGGITTSPLGASVNYIHISMESGGNCILLNVDKLDDLFAVLGKEENYPLVFHCSIGTDRTGMVSFLLLNLLGASKEQVYYDYLFSNFGLIGRVRTPSTIDDYYTTISSAKGENDQERAYNYLLNIGVNKEDLDSFINIMTK